MKIIVDTCVWSQVLRHKNPNEELREKLSDLIYDGRVIIIGPIRQELLSGIGNKEKFDNLKLILSAFEDLSLSTHFFERAAEFSSICRSKGIQGSTTDFLICSVAYEENLLIFTIDKDFQKFSKYLSIKHYE
jgi:predicted nucleic acid-binding protein